MLNNVFEHNETHISKNGEKAQLYEAFYSGFEFICCPFVVFLRVCTGLREFFEGWHLNCLTLHFQKFQVKDWLVLYLNFKKLLHYYAL